MANLITPSQAERELRDAHFSLTEMLDEMQQLREDLGRAEYTIVRLRENIRNERESVIRETDLN